MSTESTDISVIQRQAQIEAGRPQPAMHRPSNVFEEAYNFCADTVANPNRRLNQAVVATEGLIIGGIKDIPKEICQHPVRTAVKAVVATGVGAAAGALLVSESPFIAIGTLVGGSILLANGIKNTWDQACNDPELSKTMSALWRSNDDQTLEQSMKIAEKKLGPVGFDYGLATLCGGYGARVTMQSAMLRGPRVTQWTYTNGKWISKKI